MLRINAGANTHTHHQFALIDFDGMAEGLQYLLSEGGNLMMLRSLI